MNTKIKVFVLACCLVLLCKISYAAPFAYITNFEDSTLSIIDTADNTVVATLDIDANPFGVAIHPDGSQAYVTNLFGPEEVKIISAATHTISGAVPIGNQPAAIAIQPDGSFLYVASRGNGTVSVIDTSTNTVTDTITVGAGASFAAINPEGTFLYVSNLSADTISVIDTSNNTVVDTLSICTTPSDLVFNRSGSRLYVNCGFEEIEPKLTVLDPTDNSIVATVDLPQGPDGLAVHPLETDVYVSSQGNVVVIDAATNTIATTIELEGYARSLDVNPAGTFLYATSESPATVYVVLPTASGVVYVIDTQTNTVADEIEVGISPHPTGRFIGPAPALSLSRNTIDFGEQKLDTTSDPETVTLTNIGTLALNINSIDVDLDDFMLDDDCPLELLSNDFCTITITFEPFTKGRQTATVTIVSNTNESPHTITLTGTTSSAGGCSLVR